MTVSRLKRRAGCYLSGRLQRTDFLPVEEEDESEALERGYYSVSSDEEDGRGLEYAFASSSDEESLEPQGPPVC